MNSDKWNMIEHNRRLGNLEKNYLKFLNVSNIKTLGPDLYVTVEAISVNGVDCIDFEADGIAQFNSNCIRFDRWLPNVREVNITDWKYDEESQMLTIEYDGKVEEFIYDSTDLVYFIGDFNADVNKAIASLINLVGEILLKK